MAKKRKQRLYIMVNFVCFQSYFPRTCHFCEYFQGIKGQWMCNSVLMHIDAIILKFQFILIDQVSSQKKTSLGVWSLPPPHVSVWIYSIIPLPFINTGFRHDSIIFGQFREILFINMGRILLRLAYYNIPYNSTMSINCKC